MRKKANKERLPLLFAALLGALLLSNCGYRPEGVEAVQPLSDVPAAAAALPEETAAPTETPVFTVEYRLGDDVLKTESIPFDGSPAADTALPEGLYLVAWTDETGRRADPAAPVETDTVYYALARPVLNAGAAFLFPDEYGLLRPESAMTHAECAGVYGKRKLRHRRLEKRQRHKGGHPHRAGICRRGV